MLGEVDVDLDFGDGLLGPVGEGVFGDFVDVDGRGADFGVG